MDKSHGDNKYPPLMPSYNPFDIAFERGEGVYLYDAEDNKYLDFACGIAVTSLGHSHRALVAALEEQGRKLWHISNAVHIPEQERLARRLTEATGLDSVFFTNSGVEAMECAIKLARKYFSDRGEPNRHRIIAMKNSFHGRSLATLAAAGKEAQMKGFEPMPSGFEQVSLGDMEALERAISEDTAAILLEPVQGEGGIYPVPVDMLREIRGLADERGVLLMFDEIQCGMGRTGKLMAYQWADILPDIVALAKALGGGFPVGACVARGEVAASLSAGSHGSTFGGNPLAMAIGNAVLDVMLAPGFFDHVISVTEQLMAGLAELAAKMGSKIVDVRGKGLMIGIECCAPVRNLRIKLFDAGLVTSQSGANIVRLLPPLIIEDSHVDEALTALRAGFEGWHPDG